MRGEGCHLIIADDYMHRACMVFAQLASKPKSTRMHQFAFAPLEGICAEILVAAIDEVGPKD